MAWQETTRIRILYALWLLSAVVLTTTYSGFFFSLLSLPPVATPVDSIEDMVRAIQRDSYKVATVEGSFYMDLFQSATSEDYSLYLISKQFNK